MKSPTIKVLLSVAAVQGAYASGDSDIEHANHIFNAIHSSMRQWGSSLNHNGMAAWIAGVPAGTELYHGTASPYRVNGTEWLAFEPEHALIFARPHGPPADRERHPKSARHQGRHEASPLGPSGYLYGHHGPPDGRSEHHARVDSSGSIKQKEYRLSKQTKHTPDYPQFENQQMPLRAGQDSQDKSSDPEPKSGYLHTYSTKRDLRLLYLDGQSAAKSDKGTLDMQDVVILNEDLSLKVNVDGQPHHGPMGEWERASGLCKLAREDWGGRIDGVLRMEGGFEVILCSFEETLDVVHISATKSEERPGRGPPGDHPCDHPGGPPRAGLNYYRAVASRYDGIGGGRVKLEYDSFVTLFAYEGALYFDETGRPRVQNGTAALDRARSDISAMASAASRANSVDWQAIADMVVSRYADRLEYLASGRLTRLSDLQTEIDAALRPFIDYGERNMTEEIARCSLRFIPKTLESYTLAARSIISVSRAICTTLSDASTSESVAKITKQIKSLNEWLAWTTWKKCKGCSMEEVCFLPIWPTGTTEDFEQPQCRSEIPRGPGGYWKGFGGPHKGQEQSV